MGAKVTKYHRDSQGRFLVDELTASDGHVYTPSNPKSDSLSYEASFKDPYYRVYIEEAVDRPTKVTHYDANNFYYVAKIGNDGKPLSNDAFLDTLHKGFVLGQYGAGNVPARPAGWCPRSIEPAVGSCRTTMPADGSIKTSNANVVQWTAAVVVAVCSFCVVCCMVLAVLLLK